MQQRLDISLVRQAFFLRLRAGESQVRLRNSKRNHSGGRLPGTGDSFAQVRLRQQPSISAVYGSQELLALDIAVPIPPFGFLGLGGELRHGAFRMFHGNLLRKAF